MAYHAFRDLNINIKENRRKQNFNIISTEANYLIRENFLFDI